MITRKGGKGPDARKFNVVCNLCRTPSPLFQGELTPGKARQDLARNGWAYKRETNEDLCPRHAALADPLAALRVEKTTPLDPNRRLYDLDE